MLHSVMKFKRHINTEFQTLQRTTIPQKSSKLQFFGPTINVKIGFDMESYFGKKPVSFDSQEEQFFKALKTCQDVVHRVGDIVQNQGIFGDKAERAFRLL